MGQQLYDIVLHAANNYANTHALEDYDDGNVTYLELLNAIERLSSDLERAGLKKHKTIIVLCPRSANAVYSFVALNKLGCCYIPVDVSYPDYRLIQIAEELDYCPVIIATQLLSAYPELLSHYGNCKPINKQFSLLLNDVCHHKVTEASYILFTSGSSGRPKGVVITAENAMAFINWALNFFKLEKERIFSFASFSFDLSVFDIYVSLASGCTLLLEDEHIRTNPRLFLQKVKQGNATVLYITPSFLRLLSIGANDDTSSLPCIKYLLLAGEQLRATDIEIAQQLFPSAAIYNLYGPTETNVCTAYKVPFPFNDTNVPIGNVCPHLNSLLLKEGQPSTVEGELCISGSNVFAGYVNQSDNASKFYRDTITLHTFYRTGDWIEVKNNTFYYCGRTDRMIKRNGFRIEPAEIESCLLQFADINASVAIAYNRINKTYLAAFYVSPNAVLDTDLKNHCIKLLPAFMVPDIFIQLTEIPVTLNGKVDFSALEKKTEAAFNT